MPSPPFINYLLHFLEPILSWFNREVQVNFLKPLPQWWPEHMATGYTSRRASACTTWLPCVHTLPQCVHTLPQCVHTVSVCTHTVWMCTYSALLMTQIHVHRISKQAYYPLHMAPRCTHMNTHTYICIFITHMWYYAQTQRCRQMFLHTYVHKLTFIYLQPCLASNNHCKNVFSQLYSANT